MRERLRISLGHQMDDLDVTLNIDGEGARYIADVMWEEYVRSNDMGAKSIAERIARVMDHRLP